MEWAPDETTICGVRHLLEKHELGGAMLDAVNHHLDSRSIRIATGTIVDATILHARPRRGRTRSANRKPSACAELP
jgi:transposase, IS5 family